VALGLRLGNYRHSDVHRSGSTFNTVQDERGIVDSGPAVAEGLLSQGSAWCTKLPEPVFIQARSHLSMMVYKAASNVLSHHYWQPRPPLLIMGLISLFLILSVLHIPVTADPTQGIHASISSCPMCE
jgi:hypothetical protein